MTELSPGREIAATVLTRVWSENAYASAALDAEIRRRPDLDPRDAALATELSYGVLRTAAFLERAIAAHARGDRYRRKPAVRAQLLMAAYSLSFLPRVPARAAVAEAVGAVKAVAGSQVAGFANAVLRKLAAGAAPDRQLIDAAIVASVPSWLRAELQNALGSREQLSRFLLCEPVAPLCLCLAAGQDREAWIARLRQARPDAQVSAGALSPRCIVLRGAGDPRELPGADHAWRVQEQGAQLIALALGARPGERVLDACAGRGGKTLLLCEEVAPGGAVDAADRHPSKLERIAGPVQARLAVDWTAGDAGIASRYERILVDAPCTGTGTLRHRPEIAERLSASDPERMAALQLQIASRAAGLLEPGGRMVYAVCSILRAECEDVVAALGKAGLSPCPFDSELARRIAGDAAAFRLLPHVHGTDGYFVASLRPRG